MNPAVILSLIQALQGGQLSGLTNAIPGLSSILGPLTGALGPAPTPSVQASNNVAAALQLLADHMPADPAAYIAAVTQALEGLAAIKKIAAMPAA